MLRATTAFTTLRGDKTLEKHSVSRLPYLFAHLQLLSSEFLHLLSSPFWLSGCASSWLCLSICPYCERFSFETSLDYFCCFCFLAVRSIAGKSLGPGSTFSACIGISSGDGASVGAQRCGSGGAISCIDEADAHIADCSACLLWDVVVMEAQGSEHMQMLSAAVRSLSQLRSLLQTWLDKVSGTLWKAQLDFMSNKALSRNLAEGSSSHVSSSPRWLMRMERP